MLADLLINLQSPQSTREGKIVVKVARSLIARSASFRLELDRGVFYFSIGFVSLDAILSILSVTREFLSSKFSSLVSCCRAVRVPLRRARDSAALCSIQWSTKHSIFSRASRLESCNRQRYIKLSPIRHAVETRTDSQRTENSFPKARDTIKKNLTSSLSRSDCRMTDGRKNKKNSRSPTGVFFSLYLARSLSFDVETR